MGDPYVESLPLPLAGDLTVPSGRFESAVVVAFDPNRWGMLCIRKSSDDDGLPAPGSHTPPFSPQTACAPKSVQRLMEYAAWLEPGVDFDLEDFSRLDALGAVEASCKLARERSGILRPSPLPGQGQCNVAAVSNAWLASMPPPLVPRETSVSFVQFPPSHARLPTFIVSGSHVTFQRGVLPGGQVTVDMLTPVPLYGVILRPPIAHDPASPQVGGAADCERSRLRARTVEGGLILLENGRLASFARIYCGPSPNGSDIRVDVPPYPEALPADLLRRAAQPSSPLWMNASMVAVRACMRFYWSAIVLRRMQLALRGGVHAHAAQRCGRAAGALSVAAVLLRESINCAIPPSDANRESSGSLRGLAAARRATAEAAAAAAAAADTVAAPATSAAAAAAAEVEAALRDALDALVGADAPHIAGGLVGTVVMGYLVPDASADVVAKASPSSNVSTNALEAAKRGGPAHMHAVRRSPPTYDLSVADMSVTWRSSLELLGPPEVITPALLVSPVRADVPFEYSYDGSVPDSYMAEVRSAVTAISARRAATLRAQQSPPSGGKALAGRGSASTRTPTTSLSASSMPPRVRNAAATPTTSRTSLPGKGAALLGAQAAPWGDSPPSPGGQFGSQGHLRGGMHGMPQPLVVPMETYSARGPHQAPHQQHQQDLPSALRQLFMPSGGGRGPSSVPAPFLPQAPPTPQMLACAPQSGGKGGERHRGNALHMNVSHQGAESPGLRTSSSVVEPPHVNGYLDPWGQPQVHGPSLVDPSQPLNGPGLMAPGEPSIYPDADGCGSYGVQPTSLYENASQLLANMEQLMSEFLTTDM